MRVAERVTSQHRGGTGMEKRSSGTASRHECVPVRPLFGRLQLLGLEMYSREVMVEMNEWV